MSQDKKVANTVTPPTQTPRRSTVLNNVLLNKKSDYFVYNNYKFLNYLKTILINLKK